MRVTVKSIIKWGLLAEVLTAIIGQVGEFTLRYRAYSSAFDELFGHYRLPVGRSEFTKFPSGTTQEFALDAATTKRTTIETPPSKPSSKINSSFEHTFDYRLGSKEGRVAMSRTLATSTQSPPTLENTPKSSTVLGAIFQKNKSRDSLSISTLPEKTPTTTSTSLFSFDSYAQSLQEILTVPSHSVPTDPRPFLICLLLVFANLLFIIGISYEYLPLITPLTFFWLLYLILVLLILHAGSTGRRGVVFKGTPTASTTLPGGLNSGSDFSTSGLYVSPWTTLTPSPFTILVLAIILVFALVLIAIIVEERRQLAMRIRAKSAAIPLVKSRDMDLEDDDI